MTTTIRAACACKAFSLEVAFQNTSLPLSRAFCLCNTCRLVSGSCGNTYIQLPASAPPVDPAAYSLTSYETSDKLKRYFCSTCGAHIFVYRIADATWHLATGLWDRTEGVINWTGCKWVEDTGDGGISVWFKEIDTSQEKRQMKRWMLQDSDGEQCPEQALRSSPHTPAKPSAEGEERLRAHCHCNGVKFYITRPNAESSQAWSPFPDLMVPFHTGASAANAQRETWFLRSGDTKYMAGTCACTSCRHNLGFEIQTWAFVPKCNIFADGGEPVDFARNLGTLKRYESSAGVHREFCGRCGATVFWHCDVRPGVIDVSAGLLDPAQGARVEGWLDWWTERVSFEEMAVSRSLVGGLEAGLREWGKSRRGE